MSKNGTRHAAWARWTCWFQWVGLCHCRDQLLGCGDQYFSRIYLKSGNFQCCHCFFFFPPFILPDIAEDQILQLQSNRILILGFPADQKQFFCFSLYYFNSFCLNSLTTFIKRYMPRNFHLCFGGELFHLPDINSNFNIIMLQKYYLNTLRMWLFEVQETEMKTSSSAVKASASSVESIFPI